MRYLVLFGVIFAAGLAACDSAPEAPQPSGPEAAREDAAEAPPASQEPVSEETNTEPELVEESAAVPDASESDDQPIMLAQNSVSEPAGDWKFSEGKHFQRLVPTQPTVGGSDKIEVAEVFWYGCNHCLDFEPHINGWAEDLPSQVRFVRIPAMWNPLVKLHGQLYYTEQVLAKNGALENPEQFRAAVFQAYHQRGNRLTSESAIQKFFVDNGVTAEQFQSAWSSFEVAQRLRVAEDLARRYEISSVPAMVVNGKYRTGPQQAGGLQQMIDVVKELVARETAR